MKVEYSYYKNMPSLVIKGTEFIKGLKDCDEKYLLETAVDGFCAKFDVGSHFTDEANEVIEQWLDKNGSVIYTIVNRIIGRTVLDSWCEVYVLNGTQLIEITITNDYGRNFSLNQKGGQNR